jgi:hypothetical protein
MPLPPKRSAEDEALAAFRKSYGPSDESAVSRGDCHDEADSRTDDMYQQKPPYMVDGDDGSGGIEDSGPILQDEPDEMDDANAELDAALKRSRIRDIRKRAAELDDEDDAEDEEEVEVGNAGTPDGSIGGIGGSRMNPGSDVMAEDEDEDEEEANSDGPRGQRDSLRKGPVWEDEDEEEDEADDEDEDEGRQMRAKVRCPSCRQTSEVTAPRGMRLAETVDGVPSRRVAYNCECGETWNVAAPKGYSWTKGSRESAAQAFWRKYLRETRR